VTRPDILLAAWCDYAAPEPHAVIPHSGVGSVAGRSAPAGRPRAGSPGPGGTGDAAAEVEGAIPTPGPYPRRAIPRRRLEPSFEYRTIRLPKRRHLHRRARRWVGWHPVDRLGAWVREFGLLALGVVGVTVWAVSLAGVALLVPGGGAA
jgi:hypothetical protein